MQRELSILKGHLPQVLDDETGLDEQRRYVEKVIELRGKIAAIKPPVESVTAQASPRAECDIMINPLMENDSEAEVFLIRNEDQSQRLYITHSDTDSLLAGRDAKTLGYFETLDDARVFAWEQNCGTPTQTAAVQPVDRCAANQPGETRVAQGRREAQALSADCEYEKAINVLEGLAGVSQCRTTQSALAADLSWATTAQSKRLQARKSFNRAEDLIKQYYAAYERGDNATTKALMLDAKSNLRYALSTVSCEKHRGLVLSKIKLVDDGLAIVDGNPPGQPTTAPPRQPRAPTTASAAPIDCPAGTTPLYREPLKRWTCKCGRRSDGEKLFFEDETGRCLTWYEITKDEQEALGRALDGAMSPR